MSGRIHQPPGRRRPNLSQDLRLAGSASLLASPKRDTRAAAQWVAPRATDSPPRMCAILHLSICRTTNANQKASPVGPRWRLSHLRSGYSSQASDMKTATPHGGAVVRCGRISRRFLGSYPKNQPRSDGESRFAPPTSYWGGRLKEESRRYFSHEARRRLTNSFSE